MDDSSVEPRAKRQKKDKLGRFSAFEKLKNLKGSKHKYEVDVVDNIYELVDEQEYTQRVVNRLEDDWIEDAGHGYVEDGREIFDDDLDSESISISTGKGKGSKRKKKAVSESAGKGKLQYMLSTMSSGARKETAKLDNDDLLSELITELDDGPSTSGKAKGIKPKPTKISLFKEKKAVNDYMQSFSMPSKHKSVQMEEELPEVEEKVEKETEVLKEINNIESSVPAKPKLLFQVKKAEAKVEHVSQSEMDEMFDDTDFSQINEDSFAADSPEEEKPPDVLPAMENFDFDFKEDVENCDNGVADILQTNSEGEINVYWWDCFEDRINQPGVVLLFGKTYSEKSKAFVSCCVAVTNIERQIYLLPRQHILGTNTPVTMMDVYNEFNNELSKSLKSFKSKKVTKHYFFNPSVPVESEYLEVRFQGNLLFDESREFKTFSHVFGLRSSFTELFLLERKIKGPCWLRVQGSEAVQNPWSHCQLELRCQSSADVSVVQSPAPVPPPPLVVLALNIKMVSAAGAGSKVAMISCLVNNKYAVDKQAPKQQFNEHFCVFSKLDNQMLPLDLHSMIVNYKVTKVQKMDSERALLNYFVSQVAKYDPDLIVGYDLKDYQLAILIAQIFKNKINHANRLSKIRYSSGVSLKQMERMLFAGRLVCDIKISAKELIKTRSYDFDTLCQAVLKVPEGQRIEIEPENIPDIFRSSADILKMVSFTMQDNAYALKMMYELNAIPLALQITNIAGNIMSRTLMGGRSERNEYLLLHAFHEKDHIVPDKQSSQNNNSEETAKVGRNKKAAYSGGLVLDPKVGFYDKLILLMDFNSLYPSIIQEYNICFTTISNGSDEEIVLPDQSLPPGILPTQIRKLVESRRVVKKLMQGMDASQDLYAQYNIRQLALKLTANSMYGCLGFSKSRFFAMKLAALVTQKGREILTHTRDMVQKLNYEVIYGDTDSIMINTNNLDYDQVFKIGKTIKQEVNKMYKQVELDIDGVYKYLLLLKKKKYAAVALSRSKSGKLVEVQEHKGLDIVRRDWSKLSSEAGKFILNQILCDQMPDERIENIQNHLKKIKEDLEGSKVPMPLLVITKQLTKEATAYNDKNSLPHVQVALRHNGMKGKKIKAGDTVNYVICKDGTEKSATQRAYTVDELMNPTNKLSVDTNYYLAQQIHPVISRICEPIDGIDSEQIAMFLGLDASQFRKSVHRTGETVHQYEHVKKVETKFNNVKPFEFECSACKTINKVLEISKTRTVSLDQCANLSCKAQPFDYVNSIKNQLVSRMRSHVKEYYQNWFICEDPACPHKTRRMPMLFFNKYPVCSGCKKGVLYKCYTEQDLYTQLLYYQYVFNIAGLEKLITNKNLEYTYTILKETVDGYLLGSGYSAINMDELFSSLTIASNLNTTLIPPQYDLAIDDLSD